MSSKQRVLVVDDDADMCACFTAALETFGFDVDATTSAKVGAHLMRKNDYVAVLVDIDLGPGCSGLELCHDIADARPDTPVIIVTGHDEMENAVGAIRAGAFDFLRKPLLLPSLRDVVRRAAEHKAKLEPHRLRRDDLAVVELPGMIGESPAMKALFHDIAQVSHSDASVVITGESGTGKELVARAIHDLSARSSAPFVAVNCAAMPSDLLESELFGHVKGAFTDAKKRREGLFVSASGGTILLDEIGEMTFEMQAKLLRVLQSRCVRAVGDDREVPVDFRLIAATNRDLEADVAAHVFRDDLYYRINVVRLAAPPLRERGSDILLLAREFLERASGDGRALSIEDGAQKKLLEYDWPGNVRELENVVARAVALCDGVIRVGDLPEKIRKFQSRRLVIEGEDPEQLPTIDEVERRYIRQVLDAVDGNKTSASRILGMNRRTLYRKLARLDQKDST